MNLRTYQFAIAEHLPTINVYSRMHWAVKKKIRESIAWKAAVELLRRGWSASNPPMQRCEIVIIRYSTQEPDPCEINGCAKLLLDVLQPHSKKCPNGIGLIVEDSSKCLASIRVIHVPKKGPRAEVIVTELP